MRSDDSLVTDEDAEAGLAFSGGQRQPLRPDAKDDNGVRFEVDGLFLFCEVARPIAHVVGRQFAIEQLNRSRRISRAIPAVDVLLQLGARRVATDANFVPAIVDGLLCH